MDNILRDSSSKIKFAKKILLTTHSRPNSDTICSLSAMYILLTDHYKKEVDVIIPSDLSIRLNNIVNFSGIPNEKILKDLPQKFYTISIKKNAEGIDNVSYNEDDKNFNFVITPLNGLLDIKDVKIEENGSNYDLIIIIDTPSLNFLGDLYKKNIGIFQHTPSMSIDFHKSNSRYANFVITYPEVDTTSQVVLRMMKDLNINLNEITAKLLISGIYSFINLSIRNKIRSTTFEDMGVLSKFGVSLKDANNLLYAPNTPNDVYLVGDLLNSSNSYESSTVKGKIIGCKVSLNKEELETIDMEKIAQIVSWNVQVKDHKLVYVIFQRSINESYVYISTYDENVDISSIAKSLNALGDKNFIRGIFSGDMHATADKINELLGVTSMLTEDPNSNNGFWPQDYPVESNSGMSPFVNNNFSTPSSIPSFPTSNSSIVDNSVKEDSKNDEDVVLFDPRSGK